MEQVCSWQVILEKTIRAVLHIHQITQRLPQLLSSAVNPRFHCFNRAVQDGSNLRLLQAFVSRKYQWLLKVVRQPGNCITHCLSAFGGQHFGIGRCL